MTFEIRCWPQSVRKELADLQPAEEARIRVMLKAMAAEGPKPVAYPKNKTLKNPYSGLEQGGITVNKVQIRTLSCVYGNEIVVFRILRKTNSHIEKQAYKLASQRRKDFEATLLGELNDLPSLP
jgi:mRNA-degrading endonuclease RelE of RelBE toxin-antitoxin system